MHSDQSIAVKLDITKNTVIHLLNCSNNQIKEIDLSNYTGYNAERKYIAVINVSYNRLYSGEKVLIARPKNQNLVVLSEKDYNELEKAKQNAEYLTKLSESRQQIADGRIVVKTIEELEEMEK